MMQLDMASKSHEQLQINKFENAYLNIHQNNIYGNIKFKLNQTCSSFLSRDMSETDVIFDTIGGPSTALRPKKSVES